MEAKPQLLRETAEIALTEIKRFIEPLLLESFQLRRVSAPLYLPDSSPLLDGRHPGVRIRLDASRAEVEIVASLDIWLRDQLRRYDIAPGFGVFTIMNAIRPDLPSTATSSPHVATWAWQRAIAPADATPRQLVPVAEKLYGMFVDTEKMILGLFPHLHPTLRRTLDIVTESELEKSMPDDTRERRIYRYLHPTRRDDGRDPHHTSSPQPHCAAMFIHSGSQSIVAEGEIWVWNHLLSRPVRLADLGVWRPDRIAGASVGGNIFRDFLALQLLHQHSLLL